jgi:hypothetical protein
MMHTVGILWERVFCEVATTFKVYFSNPASCTDIYMKHILRLWKRILMRPLDLAVFLGPNLLHKHLYEAYYKTWGEWILLSTH